MASTIDDGSLRVTVTADGTALADTISLVSINIIHEVNKISFADITLQAATDVASTTLAGSDGDTLSPGVVIKVTAGYGDKGEEALFEGYIVKHSLEINSAQLHTVRLLCKHKAVSLTYARKEAEYANKTDSAIITDIFGTYSLSCTVTSTTASNENFFQKLGTDWDVVLSRAEFNGFTIQLDGASVTIAKPALSGSSVFTVDVPSDATAFSAELNAEKQPTAITATSWDSKTGALLSSSATEPTVNTQGNVTAKTLSGKLSQAAVSLNASTPLSTDELKTWADGKLTRARLSAIKGSVSFPGQAAVKTGELITLKNAGAKFNGDAFVTYVQHTLDEGFWTTTLRFGLDSKLISEKPDFSYQPAVGHLPAIQGLQLATVKKLSADPLSAYRVQLTIPSGATSQTGVWARMANFYATSSAGLGFLPEVGDEVVIGYLEDDPRYPVILGSLYSGKNVPPNPAADENNYIKSITTKTKMVLSFDDEKKIIILKTPAGNTITLSEDGKSIEILDQTKNSVKLSEDGIVLTSKKDLNMTATGNISLAATGKLSLDSKQDMAITSAMNIAHTAKIGFTGKGTATAEVSATGQTTIKGGVVMIN